MSAASDQLAIDAIAEKCRRGDLAGARAACHHFLAAVTDSTRRAPFHFWLGVIEQQGGALSAAIEQFELALAAHRRDPQWLLQAGLAHFQAGHLERAENLYRQSLRLEPRSAIAHYNLGVLLQHKHDLPGAQRAFEAALVHQPAFAEALVNLANTLVAQGNAAAAEQCYRRALAVNPRLANAHHGLGLQFLRRQQYTQAARSFIAAVEHDAGHGDAWLDLAECHHLAGDDARAAACIEQALAHLPEASEARATAQFKRAHYRGEQPAALPHTAVARLYAGMAGSFDAHLTQRLGYRIPATLMAELRAWLTAFPSAHARAANVLDLGCGTGLFGGEVRPFAATLVGVDLSASMLDKARERNVYDQLIESDIESWLDASPAMFDLIVATDVFIYAGPLDAIFRRVAAHLARGGRFAFSTESPPGFTQDHALQPSGRYAHGARYIEWLAAQHALSIERRLDEDIRTEGGVPVAGHVFILQQA